MTFGEQIEDGKIPAQMEIDEEETVKILTVLGTEDPSCVLFRITDPYHDSDSDADDEVIILEGIVPIFSMVAILKNEIYRFFNDDFDGNHWDSHEIYFNKDYVSVKKWVLAHSWFANFR